MTPHARGNGQADVRPVKEGCQLGTALSLLRICRMFADTGVANVSRAGMEAYIPKIRRHGERALAVTRDRVTDRDVWNTVIEELEALETELGNHRRRLQRDHSPNVEKISAAAALMDAVQSIRLDITIQVDERR